MVPMYDVAFTKPRHQRNRKCLAKAESEPKQKGADVHSRAALIRVEKIWAALCLHTFIPYITRFQTEHDTFAGQMDAQPDIDYIR